MRQQRGDVWLYRDLGFGFFVSRVHPQWCVSDDGVTESWACAGCYQSSISIGAVSKLFGFGNWPRNMNELFLIRRGRVVGRWEYV